MNRRLMKLSFSLPIMIALAGCGGSRLEARVSPQDVAGEEWPFSIPFFDVDCGNGMDVYIVYDGIAYAVRGRGGHAPASLQERDVLDIRKYDPRLAEMSPTARLPMDATRRVALKRCVDAGLAGFVDY